MRICVHIKKKKPPAEQISQRGRKKELRENGIGRNPAVKVGRWTSILKRKPGAKSLITDGAGECISVTLYLNGAGVSIHRVPHYFAGRKVKAVINGVISRSAAAAAAASSFAAVEQSFIIYSHESAMDGIFFALQMAAAGQGAWKEQTCHHSVFFLF